MGNRPNQESIHQHDFQIQQKDQYIVFNQAKVHLKDGVINKKYKGQSDFYSQQLQSQSNLSFQDTSSITLINSQILSKTNNITLASKNIMPLSNGRTISSNIKKQNIKPHQNFNNKNMIISQRTLPKPKRQKYPYPLVKISYPSFIGIKTTLITLDYKFLQIIGKGSYGKVYKAKHLSNKSQIRAIKQIPKNILHTQQLQFLFNQIQIHRKLDHPNIIKIYEIYQNEKHYYIVEEYCNQGTLKDYLDKQQHRLNNNDLKKIMKQLFNAVSYLHQNQIVHRDLKLNNLMIVRSNIKGDGLGIKIIDFGMAVDFTIVDRDQFCQIGGTLAYMAPQVFDGVVDYCNDVWSCGIIFFILSTLKQPYNMHNKQQFQTNLQIGKYNHSEIQNLASAQQDLIERLLQVNYLQRITAKRALFMPWLTKKSTNKLSISTKKRTASTIYQYKIKNNLISLVDSYLSFKKTNQTKRQQLAILFNNIDRNKNNKIQIRQLKQYLRQFLDNYNQIQAQELMVQMDQDQSGYIDFNQFAAAFFQRDQIEIHQALGEAFDFMDRDRMGVLEKTQILEMLEGIDRQEFDNIFEELDQDKNKQISKQQFISFFEKH